MSNYFENFDTFEIVSLVISIILLTLVFLGFYNAVSGPFEWLYLSIITGILFWLNLEIAIRRNERIEYEKQEVLEVLKLDERFYKKAFFDILNKNPKHYCRLEIEGMLSAIHNAEKLEELRIKAEKKNKKQS